MAPLRVITDQELIRLSGTAAACARRRRNLNIHPRLDDPVQRLFNAMEPGTYVRPHRHPRTETWELMLAVRGVLAVLVFDRYGRVLERAELHAGRGDAAVEIPPLACHTVVSLAAGTIMFEVKPGPYSALEDKDFAPWAPPEGEASAARFLDWFERARPGDAAPSLPSPARPAP